MSSLQELLRLTSLHMLFTSQFVLLSGERKLKSVILHCFENMYYSASINIGCKNVFFLFPFKRQPSHITSAAIISVPTSLFFDSVDVLSMGISTHDIIYFMAHEIETNAEFYKLTFETWILNSNIRRISCKYIHIYSQTYPVAI